MKGKSETNDQQRSVLYVALLDSWAFFRCCVEHGFQCLQRHKRTLIICNASPREFQVDSSVAEEFGHGPSTIANRRAGQDRSGNHLRVSTVDQFRNSHWSNQPQWQPPCAGCLPSPGVDFPSCTTQQGSVKQEDTVHAFRALWTRCNKGTLLSPKGTTSV